MKIEEGCVFDSNNYGRFVILKYHSWDKIDVQFIDTGYKATCESGNIRRGRVKDKMLPSVYGVGFIGDGEYSSGKSSKNSKAYVVWSAMLGRCYDEMIKKKQPTYKDCTVCKEWHNFQNFAEWFYSNHSDGLHLDKDIMVDGNKVYSPDTCTLVSRDKNNEKAQAKNYKFISPKGDVVDIYNLKKFCRENKLSYVCMNDISRERQKTHRGWRLA